MSKNLANPPRHILVVRTDRIGDVLLTLPTVSALRSTFPNSSVSFLARSYTADLVEGFDGVTNVVRCDEQGAEKSVFTLARELRKLSIDAAVVAYPRPNIALALWLVRISIRIGTGYRWYSFLFNRRVYEHRKTVEKHESQYNLSLLRPLGIEVKEPEFPRLVVAQAEKQSAREMWNQLGLRSQKPLAILHPGSRGSARDWNVERFVELALELRNRYFQVVMTGGTGEEALVKEAAQRANAISVAGSMSLKQLAAFIQTASVFVSNSTGPLHIAAAVGVPVVGFFPPVPVMSAKRWGPLTNRKQIFVPSTEKCEVCKGGPCRSNMCMNQIQVQEVAEAVEILVAEYKGAVHAS